MSMLENHERQTAVWIKLRDHMAQRLVDLRSKNDGPHDEVNTANLRGRIAQLKELLALGNPPESAHGGVTQAAPGGAGGDTGFDGV